MRFSKWIRSSGATRQVLSFDELQFFSRESYNIQTVVESIGNSLLLDAKENNWIGSWTGLSIDHILLGLVLLLAHLAWSAPRSWKDPEHSKRDI